MQDAGGLRLDLDLAEGVVCAARLRSSRPAGLARLFQGRRAEEAAVLARRLFTLCSRAHGAAARAAVAAALGRRVEMRRETVAVLAERIFETLRAPAFATPTKAVGAALREAGAAAQRLADGGGSEDIAALRRAAAALGVGDGEPEADTVFGRLVRQTAPLPPTPPDALSEADDLAVATAALADPGFGNAPELPGRHPETGPFARVWPEVGDADDALCARARARLIDLRAALEGLERLAAGDGAASGPWVPAFAGTTHGSLGERAGFAAVETARGRLYHAVKVDEESRILIYAMVAPTEWNFHALGPVVTTLLGARLGRAAEARQIAEALALRIDPCCAFEAVVREYA